MPNTIGPGGWGGDWFVWHAPGGPRARAATALRCMQAGARKLGVIEASYASAIIGVLSPVSSLLSPVSSHWKFLVLPALQGRTTSLAKLVGDDKNSKWIETPR